MTEPPVVLAEQAVLSAVLLEPRQLGRLSGWLRPEHFYRPAHAALYEAMLGLRVDGHPATKAPSDAPTPLAWVDDTRQQASTRTRGLTAGYVHSLAAGCPRPGHAPVYGRMVLEGAIHRSVAQHAHRLHQAARAEAARGSGVGETLHHAQVLTDVLDDLGRRWGTERRPASPGTSAAPCVPSSPEAVDERVLAHEEFLLGTLATHPKQIPEVVGWLRPEDFTDSGHGQIYRALGTLHHRREPVDGLTVLWECQRRGALADGTLDADRVRRLCDSAAGGSAGYFGEQVLDASLLRTAATSAHQVRGLAANDVLAPGQLISQAAQALVPLNEVRRRRSIAESGPEADETTAQQPGQQPPARAAAARARSPAPRARTETLPSTAAPAQAPAQQRPRRSPA